MSGLSDLPMHFTVIKAKEKRPLTWDPTTVLPVSLARNVSRGQGRGKILRAGC
jgi:hypothetical protein